MGNDIEAFGDRILGALAVEMGDAWKSVSEVEKELAKMAARDAAALAFRALAGDDVRSERVHVEAQLANVAAIAAIHAERRIWAAVSRVAISAIGAML